MNEERFRTLMHGAIGEVEVSPWLAQAVRTRVARPMPQPSRARWFVLVAACLAVTILAVAIAPRLMHRVPSVTPGTVVTPSGIDPSNCTLPVIITDETADLVNGAPAGPKPDRWGFVNTRTGQFTVDKSASPVRDMPVEPVYVNPPVATPERKPTLPSLALSYSPTAKRWLPEPPERVSPDGLSYAYLGDIQQTTLMRYDITTGQSVTLWVAGGQISIIRWAPAGILVTSAPIGIQPSQAWLVNPETGARSIVKFAPSNLPVPHKGGTANSRGTTETGDVIEEEAILNGPTVSIWVYYDTPDRKRVFIYQGTGPTAQLVDSEGTIWHKGSGFDPGFSIAEGGEIWFSTFAPSLTLWHWDRARGLGEVDIALAKPALPKLLESAPAGPCF